MGMVLSIDAILEHYGINTKCFIAYNAPLDGGFSPFATQQAALQYYYTQGFRIYDCIDGSNNLSYYTQLYSDCKAAGLVMTAPTYGWGYQCMPPETLVRLASGSFKRIDRLSEGEAVLSHTAHARKILEIKSFPADGLVEITTSKSNMPIRSTPNHPFYIATSRSASNDSLLLEQGHFVLAENLKVGDSLIIPIDREETDIQHIDLADWLDLRGMKFVSKSGIRTRIEVNDELLYLLGLFVGDGWTEPDGRVSIALNSMKETRLASEVCELFRNVFGLKAWVRDNHAGCLLINVRSRFLARLLNLWFGFGAKNKTLPPWVMRLPPHKQIHILRGLHDSDGSTGGGTSQISTVSEILAHQIYGLFLRQNTIPSISKRVFGPAHFKDGRSTKGSIAYVVRIFNTNYNGRGRIISNSAWLPIRSVKRIPYEGMVWNLEIETENTFTVGIGYAVHNTQFYMNAAATYPNEQEYYLSGFTSTGTATISPPLYPPYSLIPAMAFHSFNGIVIDAPELLTLWQNFYSQLNSAIGLSNLIAVSGWLESDHPVNYNGAQGVMGGNNMNTYVRYVNSQWGLYNQDVNASGNHISDGTACPLFTLKGGTANYTGSSIIPPLSMAVDIYNYHHYTTKPGGTPSIQTSTFGLYGAGSNAVLEEGIFKYFQTFNPISFWRTAMPLNILNQFAPDWVNYLTQQGLGDPANAVAFMQQYPGQTVQLYFNYSNFDDNSSNYISNNVDVACPTLCQCTPPNVVQPGYGIANPDTVSVFFSQWVSALANYVPFMDADTASCAMQSQAVDTSWGTLGPQYAATPLAAQPTTLTITAEVLP